MTTNAKCNRYVEIGETIGAFFKHTEEVVFNALRPVFTWGERYFTAISRTNRYRSV